VKRGYHALARDETRVVYRPVLWETDPLRPAQIEQVWFRGSHGDVGGQLGGREVTRPLSNIPLVWILDRAGASGLPLPKGWRDRFEEDVTAPSMGTRSEEHTSELQSPTNLVCSLLLEKKQTIQTHNTH